MGKEETGWVTRVTKSPCRSKGSMNVPKRCLRDRRKLIVPDKGALNNFEGAVKEDSQFKGISTKTLGNN